MAFCGSSLRSSILEIVEYFPHPELNIRSQKHLRYSPPCPIPAPPAPCPLGSSTNNSGV